jgi:hypothetical protein
MNTQTRRWLLAPLRQLHTRRLMTQHGPTLPYDTAWAIIAFHNAPDDILFVHAWASENPTGPPGIHCDQWQTLTASEQRRRHAWLHRHHHSPVRLLRLDPDLVKSTGLHILDWGPLPEA